MGIWQSGIEGLGDIRYTGLPQGRDLLGSVGQKGLGWFGSPGETKAKARELDVAAHTLHTSILGYTPAPELAGPWREWKTAWTNWLAALNALTNEIAGMHGPVFYGDALEKYEQSLAQWRTDFQQRWKGNVPGPHLAEITNQPKPDTFWHRVGLGVAVAVGVGAVIYLAKSVIAK